MSAVVHFEPPQGPAWGCGLSGRTARSSKSSTHDERAVTCKHCLACLRESHVAVDGSGVLCGAGGILGSITLVERIADVTCRRCRPLLRRVRARREQERYDRWKREQPPRPPLPVDHSKLLGELAASFRFLDMCLVATRQTFISDLPKIESDQIRQEVLALMPDVEAWLARGAALLADGEALGERLKAISAVAEKRSGLQVLAGGRT